MQVSFVNEAPVLLFTNLISVKSESFSLSFRLRSSTTSLLTFKSKSDDDWLLFSGDPYIAYPGIEPDAAEVDLAGCSAGPPTGLLTSLYPSTSDKEPLLWAAFLLFDDDVLVDDENAFENECRNQPERL
jgi:hypothetical protein